MFERSDNPIIFIVQYSFIYLWAVGWAFNDIKIIKSSQILHTGWTKKHKKMLFMSKLWIKLFLRHLDTLWFCIALCHAGFHGCCWHQSDGITFVHEAPPWSHGLKKKKKVTSLKMGEIENLSEPSCCENSLRRLAVCSDFTVCTFWVVWCHYEPMMATHCAWRVSVIRVPLKQKGSVRQGWTDFLTGGATVDYYLTGGRMECFGEPPYRRIKHNMGYVENVCFNISCVWTKSVRHRI